MSKAYKVNMKIDVSKLHPSGGLLMKQVPKEEDPKNPDIVWDKRGFVEQTGPEIFAFLCTLAIQKANPSCSYEALKGFRKATKEIEKATKKGELIVNKTLIDTITHSIKGNPSWPNSEELEGALDDILEKLKGAELIDENPSTSSKGSDPK